MSGHSEGAPGRDCSWTVFYSETGLLHGGLTG